MQYLGTVKSQNQIINIDIRNAENFKSVVKPTERTIKCEIDNSQPFQYRPSANQKIRRIRADGIKAHNVPIVKQKKLFSGNIEYWCGIGNFLCILGRGNQIGDRVHPNHLTFPESYFSH